MSMAGQIRAGAAYVELALKDGKYMKGLTNAQKKLSVFSTAVTSIGKVVMTAGLVVGAAVGFAVKKFMGLGDQLDKMSARTGFSSEALSELAFAAQQSGTDIETFEKNIRKMQDTLGQGAKAPDEAKRALRALGLSISALKNLSPEKQFEVIAERMNLIKDPTKKASIALSLFGRSGTALIPMLDNMKALREEARRLGIVISSEDTKAAASLEDAWGRLKMQFNSSFVQIGGALAPALEALSARLSSTMGNVVKFLKENRGLVVSFAKMVIAAIAAGAAIYALGKVIAGVAFLVKGLIFTIAIVKGVIMAVVSVITFLTTPFGLIIALIAAVGVALVQFTVGFGAVGESLKASFGSVLSYLSETFQGIKQAFEAGDFSLAVKIFWLSVKVAFLEGITWIREKWIMLKAFISDIWIGLWYGVKDVYSAAAWWLVDAWSALKSYWTSIVTFFSDAWNGIWNGIVKAFNETAGYILKKWAQLKGIFDSKINVEAEIKRIDAETQAKNDAADKRTADSTNQNKADEDAAKKQRKEEADAIKNGRAQDRKQNQDDAQKERDVRDKQYADEMNSARDALAAARKERSDALKQAKSAPGKEPEKINKAGVQASIGDISGKSIASYSVSAVLRSLGGGKDDKLAKIAESQLQETQKTNKTLSAGIPVNIKYGK